MSGFHSNRSNSGCEFNDGSECNYFLGCLVGVFGSLSRRRFGGENFAAEEDSQRKVSGLPLCFGLFKESVCSTVYFHFYFLSLCSCPTIVAGSQPAMS